MTLDVATFKTRFPEFGAVDSPLLQAKLDEANRRIDRGLWDAFTQPLGDDGQGYLAAHLLALSPFGNAAKMVAKDGTTTYEKHWRRLMITVTSGIRST